MEITFQTRSPLPSIAAVGVQKAEPLVPHPTIPFPQYFGYCSTSSLFIPSLVIVDRGPTRMLPTTLKLREQGSSSFVEAHLTREDVVGIIAALQASIGLPITAA
jgi:hypothetical protein